MKYVVPPEMKKLEGWLLSKKQFDDAGFISDVISQMENGQKLKFNDAQRFERILNHYKKVLRMQEIFDF